MKTYTEEQLKEKVSEAVEKTERSFGGTFKRMTQRIDNLEVRNAALLKTAVNVLESQTTPMVAVSVTNIKELERVIKERG